MTSYGNRDRLIAELEGAGWTRTRRASGDNGHRFYRCPCGLHFASVTNSHTKDSHRSGPIESRIKRCKAGMTQARPA